MFDTMNSIKKSPLRADPDACVNDHSNAVDCDASRARTNKSANIT